MAEAHTVSTATDRVEMALKTGDIAEALLALHGNIHFVMKKLGKSQVPGSNISKACRLKLPLWFVLQHGDKFQESVVLRCRSSPVPCKVRLSIFTKNSEAPEIRLGKGWRDFATFNRLAVGDSLIFELKGMSEFEVYVFRGTRNPTSISSSQAPKTCSTDSELSPKNGNNDAGAGCSRAQQLAVEKREEPSRDASRNDDASAAGCSRPQQLAVGRREGPPRDSSRNDDASAGCSRPQHLAVDSREGPPRDASRNDVATAGCSRPQQLAAERREGPSRDDLPGWTVKKRKIKEEGAASGPECTLQNSYCTNLHLLELENVHVPPFEKRLDSQKKSQKRPTVHRQELGTSLTGNEIAQTICRAGKAHVGKKDGQPASKGTLPSFVTRLVEYNVQDSAGNTSGARFEIPLSFVMAHGIQLQAHVKLQGIHDKSPFRLVTCSRDMQQPGGEHSAMLRPPLSLGWGDFVRNNALRTGQELVFTLAAESFFTVREVYEIVVYTK